MSNRLNEGLADAALDGSAAAAPVDRERGFALKAGVVAAGAAIAGAGFLAGSPAAPLRAAEFLSGVQHDVALTASGGFDLGALVSGINVGGNSLSGLTLSDLVQSFPALDLQLGVLLNDLGLSNGLATTLPELLDSTLLGGLGSTLTINSMLGDLASGVSGSSTLDELFNAIPMGGSATLGGSTVDSLLAQIHLGSNPISDTTTLNQLIADIPSIANMDLSAPGLLGGSISLGTVASLVQNSGMGTETLGQLGSFGSSTTVDGLLDHFNMGSISINSLLGDLGSLNGVTLSGTSDLDDILGALGLGNDSLGTLLGGNLTDTDTLSDLLGDQTLLGSMATETIGDMLSGVTS